MYKKLLTKGAAFTEYAMILAFVLVVGVVFLSQNGISSSIAGIFGSASSKVELANQGSGAAVDLSSNQKIGKYIYSKVLAELTNYQNNGDSGLASVFSNKLNTQTQYVELPNGQTVTVSVYNRDYAAFDNLKDRVGTEESASLIYDRTTGKLSTIIYCSKDESGKMTYSSWTNNGSNSWEKDDAWVDNKYTIKNGSTVTINAAGNQVATK